MKPGKPNLIAGLTSLVLGAGLAACSTGTAAPSTSGAGDSGSASDGMTGGGDSAGTDATDSSVDVPSEEAGDDAGIPPDASPGKCHWDDHLDAQPDVFHPPPCTGAIQQNAWNTMDNQPISLPGSMGGIDFVVDGGLTVGQAEQTLCQGAYLGDFWGDCTVLYAWGANHELTAKVDPATGQILVLTADLLGTGYNGAITFHGPNGVATYVIPMNAPIQKDNSNFALDTGWSGQSFDNEVDELYRGLIATFAPNLAQDAQGTTCVSTGKCLVASGGGGGGVYIPSIGFAFWSSSVNAAQPGPSTMDRMDVYRPM
jgi:hypothetical protein